MTTYFTSDTHFGHKNVIGYCNRPYASVEEMNEALIANWNARVQPGDTIYHLGDFAMGQKTLHRGFLERLQGHKILIRGNHDQTATKMRALGFDEVYTHHTMVYDGFRLFLGHIPPRDIDPYGDRYYDPEYVLAPEPGSYDLWICGHVHDKFLRRGNVINVGVDRWGYRPVTFDEIIERCPAPVDGAEDQG